MGETKKNPEREESWNGDTLEPEEYAVASFFWILAFLFVIVFVFVSVFSYDF